MSRQSKNAKNRARDKINSKVRKEGGKGPSQTSPKHNKRADRRVWSKHRRGLSDSGVPSPKGANRED